jgi:OOP family OmpA-OmpF porin
MRKAIALLLPLSIGAFALSAVPASANASDTGLYLGGGVGAYTLDIDNTDFDDGATVAKIFAGYRLHPNLAIEADYQKLFEADDDILGVNAEVDADAWTVALRPTLPITDFIDLYGKIGYTWYDVETKASLLGVSTTLDDSDSDFSWGGGVDFNFGNLSLRGELSRIEVNDADLNLLTAGVVFKF